MDEPYAEVKVRVHWGKNDTNGQHLYTLIAEDQLAWFAMLLRLQKYSHQEESHVSVMAAEDIQHEKEALEWRLSKLNEIVATSLQ
jgi:hypothetical protein